MRRQLDMIGSHRRWLGLLGVSALALLPGCGMFDSGPPPQSLKERPGAERQVAASNSLRSASSGRQYEPGIAPVDETRTGPRIGSIVAGLGGQKAQKEALDKEATERDAKAREQRQARATADKEAKAREPVAPAGTAPAAPSDGAPPSAQAAVAAPAPVSTAPIAPVAAEPAPAAQPVAPPVAPAPTPVPVVAAEPPTPAPTPVTAAAPARPADPNKAFEPPPGWVPPGQTAAPAVASTEPATAASTFIAQAPTPVPVAAAEPPTPAPAPVAVAAAAARPANPNKAFEPPPGWVPPGQTATPIAAPTSPAPVPTAPAPSPVPVVAAEPPTPAPTPAPAPVTVAAAQARPANPNKAFEPPPGWVPPGQTPAPVVASIAPPQPVVTPAPQAEPATPAPVDQAARTPQTATLDFARRSIELSAAMKAELDRVAKTFAGRIAVRSYFGGTDPDSRKVSLARALVVRRYLIDQGVRSTAIEVGTFGASGADATGERVEILASPTDQAALAPMTAAATPAHPANPNKAFEPPPGWVPLGQTAARAVASAAPSSPAGPLPPATPAPQAEPLAPAPAPANQALMGTIDFASQSIELSDAMKAELDRVAKTLAGRSPRQIEVRSYSDATDPYGRQVSLARTLIVRSYLIDQGLKARSIEVGTFSAGSAGERERVDILALGL